MLKLSESEGITTIHRENQKSFETTHQKAALSLERRKRSSDKEHKVDALALGADEGRDKLR